MNTDTVTVQTLEAWYDPVLNPPVPTEWNIPKHIQEILEEYLWGMLAIGDSEVENYVQTILETLDEEDLADRASEEQAQQYSQALIDTRRALARKLCVTEESGNLKQAFAELAEQEGVLARSNFTCCGTCGVSEIVDERDDSRPWHGYIFYHQQDGEHVPDGGTYINFGVFVNHYMAQEEWDALSEQKKSETYNRLSVELMRDKVIPVLKRNGIDVTWNGKYGTRPYLSNVEAFEIP